MRTRETAAATAADHERITTREGAKVKALAAAQKVEGRKRKGLNQREEKRIVAMLRDGKEWRDVVRRYGREIEASVLEGWREELQRRAATEDGPRLPPKQPGTPE
jgi:transposase